MSVKASANGTPLAEARAHPKPPPSAAPHASSTESMIEPLIQSTIIGEAVARAPYLIFVADEETQYLAVSDAACALLGYSREEILAMQVPQVCEEEDAPTRYREMLRTSRQRGPIVLVCKDGRRIPAYYEAHATHVCKLPYYVSILFAIDD